MPKSCSAFVNILILSIVASKMNPLGGGGMKVPTTSEKVWAQEIIDRRQLLQVWAAVPIKFPPDLGKKALHI